MPTENDKAWEKYVTDMHLQLDGRQYEVSAEKLKAVTGREPRLLAKLDSEEQLPAIFRQNGYALLAVTNGSYRLLKANIFAPVPACPVVTTQPVFQRVESPTSAAYTVRRLGPPW